MCGVTAAEYEHSDIKRGLLLWKIDGENMGAAVGTKSSKFGEFLWSKGAQRLPSKDPVSNAMVGTS